MFYHGKRWNCNTIKWLAGITHYLFNSISNLPVSTLSSEELMIVCNERRISRIIATLGFGESN